MNDDVTVTFTRAQFDVVLAAVREAGAQQADFDHGVPLSVLDLRDALRTMEAAARRGSLRLA